MKKERGILGKRIGSKHTVREPEGSIKQLSFQTSGPATSPAAEARRQPPRRTATDAKRKIEDGEAAAYERMSDEDLRHTSCESQSEKAKHHGEGRDPPSQVGKLSETERQVYWRRSPRGRHAAERRLNGVAYEYAAPREESHSHFSIRKAARDSFAT